MKNITIKVEYDKPTTNKFDLLLKQYEDIKTTANETVEYYKPLAETGEIEKLKAILVQIETIQYYLKEIAKITGSTATVSVRGYAKIYSDGWDLKIDSDGLLVWNYINLSIEEYEKRPWFFNNERNENANILGNYEKWKFYERLENQCIKRLTDLTQRELEKAEKQKNRYKNVCEV